MVCELGKGAKSQSRRHRGFLLLKIAWFLKVSIIPSRWLFFKLDAQCVLHLEQQIKVEPVLEHEPITHYHKTLVNNIVYCLIPRGVRLGQVLSLRGV
jgi:hypothetical protein